MAIQLIRSAALALMVLTIAAPALAQATSSSRPTPATDYRIGAADVLTITVFKEKDLSGDVTVQPDGTITLKVGKAIAAAGLRPDELRIKVVEELSRFFKPVPDVSIQVKQINSRATFTNAAGIPDRPVMLEVSGPTYYVDGEIRGATVGRALKLREPIEVYQTSGKTLCASASATSAKPADAGSGWRLTIMPMRFGNEVLLNVDWQRMWEHGETLTNGAKGRAVVALQPGKRILLDYITAGVLANQSYGFRPGDPDRPVALYSPACTAIGMGLQIGLPPAESRDIFEANLWLVRTLADGSERSVRQVVRVRAGTSTEFFFDDEQITLTSPKPGGQSAPPVERRVRTFGSVRPLGLLADGKSVVELVLAQYLAEPPGQADRPSGGSTTYELTAGPDEVVAFRVPQVSDNAGRQGERMSVRIQVKALIK